MTKLEEREKKKVIIIGSGPASLVCALYLNQMGIEHKIITMLPIGGQLVYAGDITNYPGHKKISGVELTNIMKEQCIGKHSEITYGQVTNIENLQNSRYKVEYKPINSNKETVSEECAVIVVATGSHPKMLPIENIDSFWDNGMHTCALCDMHLYPNEHVAVIGGGDKGAEEAINLSKVCSKVTLIHRGGALKAKRVLQAEIEKIDNIECLLNTTVKSIDKRDSSGMLGMHLTNDDILKVAGFFLAIGSSPKCSFLSNLIKSGDITLDSNGYILKTIQPIYAIGEISDNKYRQISTSCGDGCKVAIEIFHKLMELSDNGESGK